jgi:chromosome segregation ATPase
MPAKKSKEEMDEIKQSLSNIQQEIGKIASQQTQILKLFEQVDGLQKQLVTLKNENQEKNREIVNLKVRMDELEQYSRIDDGIITGLKTRHRSYANVTASAAPGGDSPQAELETLETQVVQFLSGRDLPIQHQHIADCHVFPRKQTNAQQPPAIIIRFVSRKHKSDLLKQGRKLKGTGVYLNEHLTKKNADIAREAPDSGKKVYVDKEL